MRHALDQPVGDGHTVLDEDELEHVKPTYITTRGQLNEAEQANIAKALVSGLRPTVTELLDVTFLIDLHRKMFDDVWDDAGQIRNRGLNIGIDPARIHVEMKNLVENARAWIRYATYEPDAIAVRLYHGLVAIHPFFGGNGRHGRLAADLLAEALQQSPFSWGELLRLETPSLRKAHLAALWKADAGDYDDLCVFARS
jgi:Fic-DOC domain mobile mystery protein B